MIVSGLSHMYVPMYVMVIFRFIQPRNLSGPAKITLIDYLTDIIGTLCIVIVQKYRPAPKSQHDSVGGLQS